MGVNIPSGPVTIQAGPFTITGTEMVYNGEAYVVGGNLHIVVAGKVLIECQEFHVIQTGTGESTGI